MSMYAAARSATVMGFAAIMSAPSFVREDNYDLRVTKWRLDGVKLSYRDLPDDPDHTRQFSLPYSFSEDSRQYSAQEDLKTLSKPKLFIAGEHDASVPKAVVEATYGIAAEPKKLEVLDSDHDYRKHPELIEKVNRILDAFLRQLV